MEVKCPRCGADNADGAAWCNLCEYRFRDEKRGSVRGETALPGVPEEAGAFYSETLPQPTPNRMPPPHRTPTRGEPPAVRVLVGILAALGIIGAVLAVIFITLGKSVKIQVPAPPGWEAADQKTMDSFKNTTSQGSKITIDYLFTDGSLSNFIAVVHGNAYLTDFPENEDLATVEDFFARHKSELLGQLEESYRRANADVNVETYEVKKMACGIPALHLDLVASAGGLSLQQYFLFFFKEDTMYFALVNKMGGQGAEEEIQFLSDNISFK